MFMLWHLGFYMQRGIGMEMLNYCGLMPLLRYILGHHIHRVLNFTKTKIFIIHEVRCFIIFFVTA